MVAAFLGVSGHTYFKAAHSGNVTEAREPGTQNYLPDLSEGKAAMPASFEQGW